MVLLVSEIFPSQLAMFADFVDCWVEIACPRLALDWGTSFKKPLLNPYEFYVLMEKTPYLDAYPMDYYSDNGKEWTSFFHRQKPKKTERVLKFEKQPLSEPII